MKAWHGSRGAAAALALAAAGASAAGTHTVAMEGMQFAPATLTVQRGDRITWRNADVVPHTATARGAFDSGSIATGRSFSRVMDKPGRYEVLCTFHPGMKSVVVVQ